MAESAPATDVDPRLIDIIKTASDDFQYPVVLKPTGGYRPGDARFHGKGMALDVNIINPDTGKPFPDYQNQESFRTYEQFAQKAREVQQEKYPELDKSFRWGGYFPGVNGKDPKTGKDIVYGATDLMHFDVGGAVTGGHGGGNWDTGLNERQRKLIPGAISVGMTSNKSADDMVADATKSMQDAQGGKSAYGKVEEMAAAIPGPQLANILKAYQSGAMTPEQAKDFENDVHAGRIVLPVGVKVGGAPATDKGVQPVELPKSVIDAYNKGAINPNDPGAMSEKNRVEMDAAIHNGDAVLPTGAVLNPHKIGMLEGAVDAVTGRKRQTDATRNLPELGLETATSKGDQPGLLAGLDDPGGTKKALVASAIAAGAKGPQLQQILKAQFPELGFAQDEKGNVIVANNTTGAEYMLDRPGFTKRDLAQAIVGAAAFSPAAKATTIAGAAVASGATAAALQAPQVAAGGSFSPGEVAAAAGLGGAAPLVGRVVQAAAPLARSVVGRVMGREAVAEAGAPATEAGAASQAATAPPAAAPVAPPVAPTPAPGAAAVAPAAAQDASQAAPIAGAAVDVATGADKGVAATLGRAAQGGLGSADAKAAAADLVQADPKIVHAANELGIAQHMEPDFVSTNSAFQRIVQGVKSIIGSASGQAQEENLLAISKRANDLMDTIGASTDASQVSESVKQNLGETVNRLEQTTDKIYKQIRDAIPPKTEAPADNVLAIINKRADELGGVDNLTSMEKTILKKLSPQAGEDTGKSLIRTIEDKVANGATLTKEETKSYVQAKFGNKAATAEEVPAAQPTYALLDDVRRDLGYGMKNQGIFSDAPMGLKKQLYGALTQDQQAVAEANGMGKHWELAKAGVAMRKGVENDLMSLFGKKVNGSIQTALDTATTALQKGDPSKFQAITRAIRLTPPEMRQNVVSSAVSGVLQKNMRNGFVNFTNFANWYEGLMKNSHSMNAVMSHLPPDAAKQLKHLYEVSRGIRNAKQHVIKTGLIQSLKPEFQGPDSLLNRIYGAAAHTMQHAGKHAAAELISSHLGMPGGGFATAVGSAFLKGAKPDAIKAVDAMIASPEFKQMAAQHAAGDTKGAAAKLAYSKPFIAFARSVGNPREMTDRQKWIMQGLEAKNNNSN